jgi:hypothetical protein
MSNILLTKEQYITLYSRILENRTEEPSKVDKTEDDEKYITNDELMSLLHVSKRTSQRWRTLRLLPYVKFGKKVYYLKANIMKYFRIQSCSILSWGHSPPPEDNGPDTEMQYLECLRCPLFVIMNS